MSILPLIPILILLGGALVVTASRLLRLRYPDEIASVASLLALAAMLPLVAPQPVETLVSSWQPVSVFGAPASLRVDRLSWLTGLTAILACAGTALTGLAHPGQRRFAPRALALGMTAALVASAFAANLLTVALAWGLFDALFAIGVLTRGSESRAARRAAFAIGFNTAATICLWIAALFVGQADRSTYWHLTELPETARDLLTLAAVLRLGLYPLSQWLPTGQEDTPGRLALLYILPPLAGLNVLIRLADIGALSQNGVWAWLAALSMIVGGALAWLRGRSRDALPSLSLSCVGAVVLGGMLGGVVASPAAILVNGAISWALAMVALNASRGFDRDRPWWSLAYALPIATLVGLPGSVGFAARSGLIAGVANAGDGLIVAVSLIGETLTFGALMRVVTAPAIGEAPAGLRSILAQAAALALVTLPAFLLPAFGRSFAPELAPPSFAVVLPAIGLAGGIAAVLPIALALALEGYARGRAPSRFNLAGLIGLEWLYGLVFQLVNWVARNLSGLAALLEGEGAMLWALLILIVGYVVLSGAIQ